MNCIIHSEYIFWFTHSNMNVILGPERDDISFECNETTS